MYLVGKEYRGTKTKYLCAEVGSTGVLVCISDVKFGMLKSIEDIQNIDADDEDLIIVKDGVIKNKNLYIAHKLGRCYVVWVDTCASHVMYLSFSELQEYENKGYKVINAHIDGSEYIGNTTPIVKYSTRYNRVHTYNDLYKLFLQRLYKVYSEHSQVGYPKRKPEAFNDMLENDMNCMLQIMRNFYSAEYNDWIRLLNI